MELVNGINYLISYNEFLIEIIKNSVYLGSNPSIERFHLQEYWTKDNRFHVWCPPYKVSGHFIVANVFPV